MLGEFVQLELLDEYICRQCTLVKTRSHLVEALTIFKKDEHLTSSKKKRLKALQREFDKVDATLTQDIERELKDVKLTKVFSPATKQTMIARVRSFLFCSVPSVH